MAVHDPGVHSGCWTFLVRRRGLAGVRGDGSRAVVLSRRVASLLLPGTDGTGAAHGHGGIFCGPLGTPPKKKKKRERETERERERQRDRERERENG